MSFHPADRLAFDRTMVTQPVWNRIETAAAAIGLPRNVLLHAGPAFSSAAAISRPVLNSAVVAAVYEGLARDFDEAEAAIRSGAILLKPAQDHRVVVPLAAVASASMPMQCIYDAHRGRVRVFSPINGGNGPALRLGLRSQVVLDHLRWLNGPFCEILHKGLAEGIALVPVAATSLHLGDDCHGRTAAATRLLVHELEVRTSVGITDEKARAFMAGSPSLFLNLWMAAVKCQMVLAEGIEGSGFLTAAGGNGVDMGLQVSGLPGRWFTCPSAPPKGRLDGGLPASRALPAIGDSAIVDCFGLGAMAMHLSPAQQEVLMEFMPPDGARRRTGLAIGRHPYFRGLDLRLGISARDVVATGKGPIVALGILDAAGEKGRLGGGIYDMPVAPFAEAMRALDTSR